MLANLAPTPRWVGTSAEAEHLPPLHRPPVSLTMSAGCEPGAVAWIQALFKDCIYDLRDGASFFIGLASIVIWTVAQMPQVLHNLHHKSAEGLSIWFLLQWLCGDTLNLLGCLLQGSQLITTTLLAVYFVSADVLLLSQYYYYEVLLPKSSADYTPPPSPRAGIPELLPGPEPQLLLLDVPPRKLRSSLIMKLDVPSLLGREEAAAATSPFGQPQHPAASEATAGGERGVSLGVPVLAAAAAGASVLGLAAWGLSAASGSGPGAGSGSFSAAPGHAAAAAAFFLRGMPGCNASSSSSSSGSSGSGGSGYRDDVPWWCDPESIKSLVGTIMGYSMTLFYLGSRFPQIYLNWARKSSEGLCLSMFLLAGAANACTGLSILLRSRTPAELQAQLPWLLGAVGTIGLDTFILYQGWLYQPRHQAVGEGQWQERDEEMQAPPRPSFNAAHLVAEALLTGHHHPLALAPAGAAAEPPPSYSPPYSPPLSPRTSARPPHPPTPAVPMSPRFPIFVRSSYTAGSVSRRSTDGGGGSSLSRGHSCRTAPQSPKDAWVRSSSLGHESVPASPSPAWGAAPSKRPARLAQTSLMHHAEEGESKDGSRCSSQLDLSRSHE